MITKISALIALFHHLVAAEFYGSILVKMEKGRVVLVRKEETIKL